jgi:hypothetical protein
MKTSQTKHPAKNITVCAALILILLQSATLAAPLSYQQVSNAVQRAAVRHYPAGQTSAPRFSTPSGWSRRAVQRVDHLLHNGRTVGYVLPLFPSGYYLVPTDDQLPPWKLRTEEGEFDNLPPGLIHVIKLELAEEQQYLDTLRKSNRAPDRTFHEQWQSLLSTGGASEGGNAPPTSSPGVFILTTTWNQNAPYNQFCPTATGGPAGRAFAGCTACALAQILRYHNQPTAIFGDHIYTDILGTCRGTHAASDVDLTGYDWGNMPNSVTASSPQAQRDAIARLMYHCAVVLDSDFEGIAPPGTGAYPSSVPDCVRTYFHYASGNYESKSSYTSANWYSRIAAFIDQNLPVFYAMWQVDGSDGHAVVCDGYQNGNEIHLNLGWSGNWNAWYNIDTIVASGNTWTRHSAVFGITPPGRQPPTYTLQVQSSGASSTTVDLDKSDVHGFNGGITPFSVEFLANETVTLQAAKQVGSYTFNNWNGDLVSQGGNHAQAFMERNKTVTAN